MWPARKEKARRWPCSVRFCRFRDCAAERIRHPICTSSKSDFGLNGECCSPEDFVQLVDKVSPAVSQLDQEGPESRATYFEIATAMSFLFFRMKQVDVAVLEVGLGGRLDSTNVCLPLATVITSISF